MRALIQRVSEAAVTVEGAVVGAIGPGLLVLLGVGPADTEATAEQLLTKVLALRIHADAEGKMNRSLSDTGGGLLVVSQFTLYADTRKGNRPSFTGSAPAAQAERLYVHFVAQARQQHAGAVATGRFGAHMHVSLVNDGPVTIWLDTDA